MEKVTFNDLMETIEYYVDNATNPRNDGWTHNYYRKWIKAIQDKIKKTAEIPLHKDTKDYID